MRLAQEFEKLRQAMQADLSGDAIRRAANSLVESTLEEHAMIRRLEEADKTRYADMEAYFKEATH
jgi:hypothetical protein